MNQVVPRRSMRISTRLIAATAGMVVVMVVGGGILARRELAALHHRQVVEETGRFRHRVEARGQATSELFAAAVLPLLAANQDAEIDALVRSAVARDSMLRAVYVRDRDRRLIAACEATADRRCAPPPPGGLAARVEPAWQALDHQWRRAPADREDDLVVLTEAEVQGGRALLFAAPVFARGAGSAAAAAAAEAPDERYGYVTLGYDLEAVAAVATAAERARAEANAASLRRALGLGGLALGGGVALAVLFSLRLTRPITRLASQADRIARGDLDLAVTVERGDEIGQLATSFAAMVEAVRHRDRALRAHNEQLEAVVAARTRAIALLLDTAGDAFVPVGLDLRIEGEVSASARAWFGDPAPGVDVASYLCPADGPSGGRDLMQVGFEQLVSEVLPFDVAAAQLPARLTHGGRIVALDYRPVLEGEQLVRVLVIARDVTAQVAAEAAEADARELHAAMAAMIGDRRGFLRFVAEVGRHLDVAGNDRDPAARLRALHTIKGDAGCLGLTRLAAATHAVEACAIDAPASLAAGVAQLTTCWQALLARLGDHLALDASAVTLSAAEHADFVARLATARDPRALVAEARAWSSEPLANLLARAGDYARQLGERRGRRIDVEVAVGDVRVDDAVATWLWSGLLHLVRNAIDHGVEPPDERVAAGKPVAARLRLTAQLVDGELQVTCGDDGRGIDWAQLRGAASRRGLRDVADTELLFLDGLSTAAEVTDTSGRGVGLSAVRAACRAAGGDIRVHSEPGHGAQFVLQVRAAVAHAA